VHEVTGYDERAQGVADVVLGDVVDVHKLPLPAVLSEVGTPPLLVHSIGSLAAAS
jgi:hypothetical protein